MKSQFSPDLNPPNPDTEYYGSKFTKCKGWTLLHKLVFFPDLLQDYLSRNPRVDINVKNIKGWTPLALACRNSNTDSNVKTVKFLLDNGADINVNDNIGRTPLMYACRYSNTGSNVETVQLLLDNGADVNSKNNEGWTPLALACGNSNTDSNVQTVKLLLDRGADVNLKNNGWSPLMLACRYINTDSNVEAVQLLLDRGEDVNVKNNSGRSPLMLLLENKQSERALIIRLIEMKCETDCLHDKHNTVLSKILLEERKTFKSRISDMQAFRHSSASKLFEYWVTKYM
jgi:ankyrin repeat protein